MKTQTESTMTINDTELRGEVETFVKSAHCRYCDTQATDRRKCREDIEQDVNEFIAILKRERVAFALEQLGNFTDTLGELAKDYKGGDEMTYRNIRIQEIWKLSDQAITELKGGE